LRYIPDDEAAAMRADVCGSSQARVLRGLEAAQLEEQYAEGRLSPMPSWVRLAGLLH